MYPVHRRRQKKDVAITTITTYEGRAYQLKRKRIETNQKIYIRSTWWDNFIPMRYLTGKTYLNTMNSWLLLTTLRAYASNNNTWLRCYTQADNWKEVRECPKSKSLVGLFNLCCSLSICNSKAGNAIKNAQWQIISIWYDDRTVLSAHIWRCDLFLVGWIVSFPLSVGGVEFSSLTFLCRVGIGNTARKKRLKRNWDKNQTLAASKWQQFWKEVYFKPTGMNVDQRIIRIWIQIKMREEKNVE